MNRGLVSVIIPFYNDHEYIHATVESVKAQTYSNTEIVIVDDGSDEPLEPITGTMLIQKDNGGAGSARNAGMKYTTGQYMYFLDADTTLYDYAFEYLLATLQANPDCAFAYSRFKWGNRMINSRPYDDIALSKANFISTMSMVRRDKAPKWDETLVRYQDWCYWLEMLRRGKRGVFIRTALFDSPDRPDGISKGTIGDREARNELAKIHPWANIWTY